ncbi:hypothetical protein A3Q56_01057 [Intoshia linei]|uniref:Uncharacterized protein n=1 Tax=Intoshia linei TaxID=1819745 RepID=A0A177BA68_9BILA|nr:hypothetical protein A3Q56_01057 [Intoshia linei]
MDINEVWHVLNSINSSTRNILSLVIISGVYNNCRNWINQNDNFFNAEREPFIDDDFNFSMFDILPVESMDVFSNYMDRVKRDKKNESYESCQNINFSYNDTVQSEFDRQKLYGEPSVMIDFASDNNVHVLPSVKYVYDKLVDSLTRSVCQEYGLKSNFENTVCNVNVSEIVLGMYLNEYCGILLKPILTEFCNMNRIIHSATNMILDSFLERFIRENEKVIDCVRVNPILKVDNVNNCKFENETNLKSGIKCTFKNISDSPVEKKQTKKIVKSKYNTLYIRKCYRKHVLERYWYKWRFVISFKKFLIHLSLTRPLFLDFISNDSFILIKNAAKNFYKHFDDAIFTNLILYEIQKTKTDNSQSTCNFYSTLSISSCLMKVVDTDDQGVFIWTVHIHILNDSSALQIWIRCKIESEFYNMQHVQFKINNKYFIKFQYENFDTISQNIGPFDLHLLILDHVKYLPEKITKESHVLFFKNDSNLDILCKDLYKLERDKLNFTVINCNNDAHLCLETSLVKLFQVAYQNSSPLYEICFFSFMQHITLEFIKYPISECSENESNYRFWDSGKIINFYNYQMKKILSYLINMFKSFNVYYQFSTDEIVNYLSLHLYTLFDTFKITKKHLHRFESFDHFECFIKDNLEASSDKYNRLIVFYKNILNDCKCKDISDLCEKDRIYLCNKIIFQLINAKLNLNKVNYIDSKLNVKILYSPTTLEKLLYIPIKTLDKYFYVYTKEISFEMNDLIEPIENQNKSIKDATNIVVNKNETHPEMVKVSLKKYLNKRIKKLQKFNNEEIKGDYNL